MLVGTTTKEPIDYVNPLIGTTLNGNVIPNVGLPFGMTQWTPQTRLPEKKGIPPYLYYDPMIQGFQGSHWLSGGATQDYGSVTLMPTKGKLNVLPQKRASFFNRSEEIAKPYYYRVRLTRYNIVAQLTGTTRCGFMKFTYPKSDSSYIIIDTNAGYQPTTDSTSGKGYIKIIPSKNEVVGYDPVYRMYQGWGQAAGFAGYFVTKFNQPFASYGTWNWGKAPTTGSKTANNQPGAFIRFNTKQYEVIKVKIGTSFTSIKEAQKNLRKEIPGWNFKQVKLSLRKIWESNLGKINIQGGTTSQRKTFYTALYHAFQLPRVISNTDGSYVGFDSHHKEEKANGYVQYGDYSLWDIFRAEGPLLTLLEPNKMRDMIVSLIKKGEQGGFLPIFPAWSNYTSEMIGDHAIPFIVDAYRKGIRDFDVQKAYKLMKRNATQLPSSKNAYISGKGRRALKSYIKYGYIPLEYSVKYAFHQNEQVSRTLEYAYDDWCLAQMAKVLNHPKDYTLFSKRAQNYKNVFDTTTGFVRGRYANGSWSKPFNPADHYSYITEGTPWQYSWFVPQNIPELIKLMGGRQKFISKLNTFFKKSSKFNPQFQSTSYYTQGNEPDESAAYLFDYAGAPWKTQYWVRQIMKRSYQDNAGGLPGNDDAGQLSAWYVFSAIGLYPVCPGNPIYAIGSPIFKKIVIDIGNGKNFTIIAKNNSSRNIYIQSAKLNGKKLNIPFISHTDIIKGGRLTLVMGNKPNKE
jgi:predicted alpha-1,2-mannosidase